MTAMTPSRIASLASAALLAACASAPAGPDPKTASATPDCARLEAAIGRAEEARRVAAAHQQDAWKVVVPFAVAARYASARSAVDETEQRLGELHAAAASQGCPRHGD